MRSLPSFEEFRALVETFKKRSEKVEFLMRIFDKGDDETNVFDYINDDWYEYTYGEIEKTFISSYFNEKSDTYKSAYFTVEICLRHKFFNGNKRSALLTLLAFLYFTDKKILIKIYSNYLHKFIKKVAEEGNENRDKNIDELTKYLDEILLQK